MRPRLYLSPSLTLQYGKQRHQPLAGWQRKRKEKNSVAPPPAAAAAAAAAAGLCLAWRGERHGVVAGVSANAGCGSKWPRSEAPVGAVPPPAARGLYSNNVALITSDCGSLHSLDIKWP